MDKKNIIILGSTGSIGRQSIEVAAHNSISVEGIAAHTSVDALERQARECGVKYAVMTDERAATELKRRLSDTDITVFSGMRGIEKMIKESGSDKVINALVGRAGLLPSIWSLENKKTLALANKESLVCAGDIVNRVARENGKEILPVDSEHSAIWQCLPSGKKENIERLILTASGGPFFGKRRDELSAVTRNEALAHPTWSMGEKITIDSATMMNKGFEIIEAAYLFGIPADKISVVVHRESIVHSIVEFCDGAMISEMGIPDMRLCIALALSYPERFPRIGRALDLTERPLTFHKPDDEAFPLMNLARECVALGGTYPAVLNAADEAAVRLFLDFKITFSSISDIIERAVHTYGMCGEFSLEEIMSISDKVESDILSSH